MVSEINERLSPNIEPPTTAPKQTGTVNPELAATATAIGEIKVIVPTEVPIAKETNALTTNKTKTANCGGIKESIKYATLSALLLPTTPTKTPATIKIKIMITIFLSPTPFAIKPNFSSNFTFGFWKQATKSAIKKITTIGML